MSRLCFGCDHEAKWWIGPFGDWACDDHARPLRERGQTNIHPIDDHPAPLASLGVLDVGGAKIDMAPVQRTGGKS